MSTAAQFKDQGNKHLQAKEFEQAITCYTKAIELDPNDHVFYSNRSAAYLSLRNAEKALEDANSCVRVKSDWPKGYTRQGAAFHAMRRYDEAVKAYEAGLKIDPNDAGLKSGLAEVKSLADQARTEAGPGLFDASMLQRLATNPKFAHRLSDPNFMAKLRMMQTNPTMMMQDPEMVQVLQAMYGVGDGTEDRAPKPTPASSSSSSSGGPSSSSSSSSSSSANAPKFAAKEPEETFSPEEVEERKRKASSFAAKERGNAFYKEKKFAEAHAAYDEAIALDPSNMMLLNNKAAVFIETGDIDTAISCCTSALEIGRQYRAAYEDKAKVYQRIAAAELKRNNIPDAIKAYEKAQMEHSDKAIQKKMKDLELEYKKTAEVSLYQSSNGCRS